MPTDMTVAKTILDQLGGRRFVAMTGAKDFLGGAASLTFSLPARLAQDGINRVRVTLDPDDTYTVEAFKLTARSAERLAEQARTPVWIRRGVYCDGLAGAFSEATGLETSLGAAGPRPGR
jgi:hypothetical protein